MVFFGWQVETGESWFYGGSVQTSTGQRTKDIIYFKRSNMSDERPVFARFRCPFATIEYFEARHWRLRQGMPVYPAPRDILAVDWLKMYRLRINGRWFGPRKFSFYTMVEAAQIMERILDNKTILTIEAVKTSGRIGMCG